MLPLWRFVSAIGLGHFRSRPQTHGNCAFLSAGRHLRCQTVETATKRSLYSIRAAAKAEVVPSLLRHPHGWPSKMETRGRRGTAQRTNKTASSTMSNYRRMAIDVGALIDLVRERPVIWNNKHKGYSDRLARDAAWLQICKSMYPFWDDLTQKEHGVIENDLKTRWRSARDRFRKDHTQEERSGSSPSQMRKYFHYEQLMFLAPTRDLRPSDGNYSSAMDNDVSIRPHQSDNRANRGCEEEDTLSNPISNDQQCIADPDNQAETRENHASSQVSTGVQVQERIRVVRRGGRGRDDGRNVLEAEALCLLRRVAAEDKFSGFGSTVAGQCRSVPASRQNAYMTFVMSLGDIFSSEKPMLPVGLLISKFEQVAYSNEVNSITDLNQNATSATEDNSVLFGSDHTDNVLADDQHSQHFSSQPNASTSSASSFLHFLHEAEPPSSQEIEHIEQQIESSDPYPDDRAIYVTCPKAIALSPSSPHTISATYNYSDNSHPSYG